MHTRTTRRDLLLALLLLLALPACKTAPASAPGPATDSAASLNPAIAAPLSAKWNYLSATTIDTRALLPTPPDSYSPQARAFESQLTLRMKQLAGPVLSENAEADENDSVWQFASVMGPEFSPERCPKIAAFIQRATADGNRIKNIAKDSFARRRPPTATEAGETYAAAHTNPVVSEAWSYPSGHATRAALWACLLGQIDPTKQEALLREGWFMCLSRIVRGVHFPGDITAGFILGQAVAAEIMLSPQAAADLAAARDEWQAIQSEQATDQGP